MEPKDLNASDMARSMEDDTNPEQPASEKMVFAITLDQAEIVRLVMNDWKKQNGAKAEDNGSALYAVCLEYTRNHPLDDNERSEDASLT